MFESQIEIDFVAWLRELSKNVVVRYGRYFETNDGRCEDSDFCTECVQIERWKRKHEGSKFIKISGWDESFESDSLSICHRCGCMIEFTPTNDRVAEDIQYLAEVEEIHPESAWEFHNWMSCLDDYGREELWPQIKPHAERLMQAAGLEIVPDGLIRYVPAQNDWSTYNTAWLSIYQDMADLLDVWMRVTGKGERGFLVDTSARNIHHFQTITCPQDAKTCVQKLLSHVGKDSPRGEFLARIGLTSEADLLNSILIKDGRCNLPTFDVRGRRLKVSPNQFHPDAVVITHAELTLSNNAEEWVYSLYYSDKHWEKTSWSISIDQNTVTSMPAFCDGVRQWLDEILVPAGRDDQWRKSRLEEWDRVREAVSRLFSFNYRNREAQIETLMNAFMPENDSIGKKRSIVVTPEVEEMILGLLEPKAPSGASQDRQ